MAVKNDISPNRALSFAITWLRFPLIFMIIMLHCYSTVQLTGNHEGYFQWIYPFALWLGETGVPGFFFISGYLFYSSAKSYKQKLNNRVHTLLIPYLLWNLLLVLLYTTAYALGFPQDINGKNLENYNYIDYLRLFWDRGSYDNGNFVPILCPLWYIRNLLIMAILSPIFFYLIKYIKVLFLVVILIWWMTTYHNAFIPQTVFFFCLGAYFSILKSNPLYIFYKRKRILLSLFIIFGLCDIITHTICSTPINLQIHRFALITNIPAFFLLADYCSRHGITSKLLPNAAFIVFCVHYPIVVLLRKICITTFSNASVFIQILLYFVCVIIATALSIAIYLTLNRFTPRLKNILSGNR